MAYSSLISRRALSDHLGDENWAIVDCRFYLLEPDRGEYEYQEAHIPGSVYAHLDRDLSGQIVRRKTGRHPLPSVEKIKDTFSKMGIGAGVQVVAYDSAGGALAASRLWWILHWLGHEAAAVLDGGWQGWQRQGLPVRSGVEERPYKEFSPFPQNELVVSAEEVQTVILSGSKRLVDARTSDRFRGENEVVDPVAGHIPGAVNMPYPENLDSDGYFLSPQEIRNRYKSLFGDFPEENTIHYCGSGATAAHNLLALVHAGLKMPKLYAGSWSEWITKPDRSVATREEDYQE
jgi:thiosulfate/3-mercaptopyruvate sulfurtransferase